MRSLRSPPQTTVSLKTNSHWLHVSCIKSLRLSITCVLVQYERGEIVIKKPLMAWRSKASDRLEMCCCWQRGYMSLTPSRAKLWVGSLCVQLALDSK